MLTEYDLQQQAIERARPYVNHLVSQGTLPDVALSHASHKFGVKLSTLRHAFSDQPEAVDITEWGVGSHPDMLTPVGSVPLSTDPLGETS